MHQRNPRWFQSNEQKQLLGHGIIQSEGIVNISSQISSFAQ